MSKSYQNTINLSDPPEKIREKVRQMFTDPRRIRLQDPGHPDECNVHGYFLAFAPEKAQEVRDWCIGAKKGCTECKLILADCLIQKLAPIREKREALMGEREKLYDILADGRARAKHIAVETMREVREAVRI